MCGIVGHIGPQNSLPVVLEGLKRLEYRGYDSAGVSFLDDKNQFQNIKKAGRLSVLSEELSHVQHTARVCIGHTRWATHGEVNDVNSHPHDDKTISIVHNGIIENADELKKKLLANGASFLSDTDSEVFLKLLLFVMQTEKDFSKAIFKAFSEVRGNSAFVILNSTSCEIYAIKRSAPLVCGTSGVLSDAMVSSDPYALAGYVDRLYFPEDNVLCQLSAKNENLLNFYESDLSPSDRVQRQSQDLQVQVSEKGEFEHFMHKEIHEQPELIRSLTGFYFEGEGKKLLESIKGIKPKRILIMACGTAYYAGLVVKDYLEEVCRIPTIAELASEFRYRNPILQEGDLAVFISQSGETADTLAALEICKKANVPTLALLNVSGSTLDRQSDYTLNIRAGVEICVASTKAYTQMALTGMIMAEYLKPGNSDSNNQKEMACVFSLLAKRIDSLIAKEDELKVISENIYHQKGYFYTGRGKYFSTCLEGALKLKEIAYVHAEGYAAGELKHGPIALIDEEMVNIAVIDPDLYDKTLANLREVKARKGIIVAIGPENDEQIEKYADYYIGLNFEGLNSLAPLYVNVVNQLLAYHMAKFKGTDIDQPRNLAKSVTVE